MNFLYSISLFIVSVGGVGFCKVAPGTVASVFTTVAICLVRNCHCINSTLLYAFLISCAVSLPCIRTVIKHNIKDSVIIEKHQIDPSYIVIDEVIGQLQSFLIVSMFCPLSCSNILLALISFRAFDIFKPWPIRTVERTMESKAALYSLSVIVDDILAGVFAGITTSVLCNKMLSELY